MKLSSIFAAGIFLVASLVLSGCSMLEDNGTHLAYALERGAAQLRSSNLTEYIVHYTPLGGGHETYEVKIDHSSAVVRVDALGQIKNVGGGYLIVTGRHPGGTNYHERFIFAPKDLRIVKTNASTDLVLRKSGNRIDLVELR